MLRTLVKLFKLSLTKENIDLWIDYKEREKAGISFLQKHLFKLKRELEAFRIRIYNICLRMEI